MITPTMIEDKLSEITDLLDKWFAPWGEWKTEWWESVSGDEPFSSNRMLLILRDRVRENGND